MNATYYPNAPIAEAVIDLQVKLTSLPSSRQFMDLAADLSATFPHSTSIKQLQVNVGITADNPPTVAHTQPEVLGQRLTRTQNDRVLTIQPRGMTFSHLRPYSRWEAFRSEAAPLWKRYVDLVKPEAVTRIALRYINHVYIPKQSFELSDYFLLYPGVPKGIPQNISAFFMQLQMPQDDINADIMAVINLTTGGVREDDARLLILDLDVFAQHEIPAASERVFSTLDVLRTRKNELFEACITDEARKLFQ